MADTQEERYTDIATIIEDFQGDLRKTADGLQAALTALTDDDLDGAQRLVGFAQHALERLEKRRTMILSELRDLGATPPKEENE
jgi:hypothetical protein